MWLIYFDESKDSNDFFVYSALIVDSAKWHDAFKALKHARVYLRQKRGIYQAQELHASEFAAGKGEIANHPIRKQERAQIFRMVLRFAAKTKLFRIISSVNQNEFYAFDRIMNRINRTAEKEDQKIILVCDEGQETVFTRRLRKMRVHNPIPSKYRDWGEGEATKNIPTSRFLEDPFFKDSAESYFIQLVDFCAYALLRMERPIPERTVFGYDTMYEELRPMVITAVNENDPRGLGIIR